MPRPSEKGLPPGIQKQIDDGDLKANLGNSYLADLVADILDPDSPNYNIITGTEGDDLLEGTDGEDLFQVSGGDDVITGFDVSSDLIDLTAFLPQEDGATAPVPDEEEQVPDDGEENTSEGISDEQETEEESVDGDTPSAEDGTGTEPDEDDAGDTIASTLIADVLAGATETEDGVLLAFESGTLLLEGVALADLSADNFYVARDESDEATVEEADASDPLAAISSLVEDADAAIEMASSVFRLYKAAFARTPDSEGLDYWLEQAAHGLEIASMATGFMQSSEFASIYGSEVANGDFIDNLYQNVLGRAADAEGLNYWSDVLEQGGNREDILISFAESEENVIGVQQSLADAGIL